MGLAEKSGVRWWSALTAENPECKYDKRGYKVWYGSLFGGLWTHIKLTVT